LLMMGFFQDRVSQTICSGWLQTTILLISASRVARITGMGTQPHLSFPYGENIQNPSSCLFIYSCIYLPFYLFLDGIILFIYLFN
jgi:hypothetical protein